MEENKGLPQDVPDDAPEVFEGLKEIMKQLPKENQEELAEKIEELAAQEPSEIQKLMMDDLADEEIRAKLLGKKNETKWRTRLTKEPDKRGVGYTRKSKDKGRKSQKISKKSRKQNRGK